MSRSGAIGRERRAEEFRGGGSRCGEPTRGGGVCALTMGHSGGHRADPAFRAGQAAAARKANRQADLDPAKKARDLAALDPAARARVERYSKHPHY